MGAMLFKHLIKKNGFSDDNLRNKMNKKMEGFKNFLNIF